MTQCLVDITDLSVGLSGGGSIVNDMISTHQLALERSLKLGPYHDLESYLQAAVKAGDENAIRELVHQSDVLCQQPEGKKHVARILWRAIIDAPSPLADVLLSCPAEPFDFQFIDDINGRSCLHEAAITGELRLVDMCIQENVQVNHTDVYGTHCSLFLSHRCLLHPNRKNCTSLCCYEWPCFGVSHTHKNRLEPVSLGHGQL